MSVFTNRYGVGGEKRYTITDDGTGAMWKFQADAEPGEIVFSQNTASTVNYIEVSTTSGTAIPHFCKKTLLVTRAPDPIAYAYFVMPAENVTISKGDTRVPVYD